MRSMTGYGEAAEMSESYSLRVQLRAVNHRSLDLGLRLPDACRPAEDAVRQLLTAELRRGRIEVTVDCRAVGEADVEVRVRGAAVEQLAAVTTAWQEAGWIGTGLTAGDLLRLPGVVELEARQEAWKEEDQRLLLRLVGEALGALVATREREGAALGAALVERLATLDRVHGELERRREELVARIESDLRRRLETLLHDLEIDPQRLAQEAAILVDKSDVREELDRLRAHLDELRLAIDGAGALGKRLDFIAQEIGRELNTVAAKARDADLIRLVVDGKTACEQIREQLMNVE